MSASYVFPIKFPSHLSYQRAFSVIIVSKCMLLPQFRVNTCHHLECNCYSVATLYQKNKCNNSANIPQFLIMLHPLTFVTFFACRTLRTTHQNYTNLTAFSKEKTHSWLVNYETQYHQCPYRNSERVSVRCARLLWCSLLWQQWDGGSSPPCTALSKWCGISVNKGQHQ